jgi:tryptophan synthase alpha chain
MAEIRIENTFNALKAENRAALVTYIMASDPNEAATVALLKALPDAGADIIELGMPFSDPMADGPTIQEAAIRSLKSGGSLKHTLSIVQEFRKENDTTPIILMGYYNPIHHYGVERFTTDAIAAGVDGVIIVDLPPEEEKEFTVYSQKQSLALVRLTTPTTDGPRAKIVLENASGFVYYVSIAGVTGTKSANIQGISDAVTHLKQHTKLPIAVGFGISTPEQVAEVSAVADAVVVGSAIVKEMQANADNVDMMVDKVSALVKNLAAATVRDGSKAAINS